MSAIAARAASRKRAESKASLGATRSRQWCGTRARSAAVGLAVPMSRSRYTCRESADTISPPTRSARSSASALFPLAVGPTMQRTRMIQLIRGPPASSPKQRFQLAAGELGGDGAAVRAVGRDLDAVHRREERLRLGRAEPLPDAHHAVAGDGGERRVGGALGRRAGPFLDQLAGDGPHEGAHVASGEQPW